MDGTKANDKIYKMSFSKVYPLLVAKCEKKGRTREEVDQVTCYCMAYLIRRFFLHISTDYAQKAKEMPLLSWNIR